MIGEIQYGEVVLKMTKINNVRREIILSDDGVDYLYTQTTVDVTVTYNPATTSYASGTKSGVPSPGVAFAGRTDRILTDYLSQPRRRLLMWTYDKDLSKRVYLESPSGQGTKANDGLVGDAKNGPVCKVCSVQEVHGARTWIMHLQFTTWVNNCYDKDSPILSHRWERNIDTDEQFRAIVTTTGTVVFHAGRLYSENPRQSPDFYREQFFQPPPPNFAREHVNVNVSSDNTTARYTVVDVERFFNVGGHGDPFGVSPAVKVEAHLTTWCGFGSIGNVISQNAPTIASTMWESIPGPMDIVSPGGMGRFVYRAGSANVNMVRQMSGTAVDQLPKYYANIKVRAHGARNSSRRDLSELCMAIAFSRLGSPTFWTWANRSEIVMNQDLCDTFVEIDFTLRWMDQTWVQLVGALGPIAASASMLPIILQDKVPQRFFDSYLGVAHPINDITGNNTTMETNATGQPGIYPPGRPLLDHALSNRTASGVFSRRSVVLNHNRPMNTTIQSERHNRGVGYVGKVLTQALKGDLCDTPPIPGNVRGVGYRPNIWDTTGADDAIRVRTRNFPLLQETA